MNKITPSQFIEALLESQRTSAVTSMELKVRTFNNVVDRLSELDFDVQFGYSDLIEFAENFGNSLPYKNFALHISYTDALFNEINKYNQIYASVNNYTEIDKIWKKLLK